MTISKSMLFNIGWKKGNVTIDLKMPLELFINFFEVFLDAAGYGFGLVTKSPVHQHQVRFPAAAGFDFQSFQILITVYDDCSII
jgi:hypothetical protein